MDRHTEVALIRRALAHLAAGTTDRGTPATVPVARYFSPERLAREQAMIRGLPGVVCAASDVASQGDWVTHDLSGVPLLILRGQDGQLRGFVNACRHRAARLVEGARGRGRGRLVCPYHAWSYAPDGALIGMPDSEDFAGLERSESGLAEIPLAQAAGLVWAVPTARTRFDIRAWLAPLVEELESFGFGHFSGYAPRRFESAHDWKLAADANLEAYHFAPLHRNTIAPLFHGNRMVADRFGDHWRIVLPKQGIEALAGLPQAEWRLGEHSNIIYFFFPSTLFLVIGDHATTFTVWPRAVGASVVDAVTLIPEAPATDKARAHWDRNVRIFWDALDEDFAQMAAAQSTLASGANTHLTFGASEFCSAAFEEAVERHLGEAGA